MNMKKTLAGILGAAALFSNDSSAQTLYPMDYFRIEPYVEGAGLLNRKQGFIHSPTPEILVGKDAYDNPISGFNPAAFIFGDLEGYKVELDNRPLWDTTPFKGRFGCYNLTETNRSGDMTLKFTLGSPGLPWENNPRIPLTRIQTYSEFMDDGQDHLIITNIAHGVTPSNNVRVLNLGRVKVPAYIEGVQTGRDPESVSPVNMIGNYEISALPYNSFNAVTGRLLPVELDLNKDIGFPEIRFSVDTNGVPGKFEVVVEKIFYTPPSGLADTNVTFTYHPTFNGAALADLEGRIEITNRTGIIPLVRDGQFEVHKRNPTALNLSGLVNPNEYGVSQTIRIVAGRQGAATIDGNTLTYTPLGVSGTEAFRFVVDDALGNTSGEATLSLTSTNSAPVRTTVSYEVDERESFDLPAMSGYAFDADGDPLSEAIVDDFDFGVISNGRYVSTTPYHGPDIRRTRVTDNEGTWAEGNTVVNVNHRYYSPEFTAVPNGISLPEDSALVSYPVSAYSWDKLPLEIRLIGSSALGEADYNSSSGQLTYIPIPNRNGTENLRIGASDGISETVATIPVNISTVHDVPVATG